MWNTRLDELQAGIKIAGRSINNLRYTTLMAENEEELKSLLIRAKEESEKTGLKLNIKKKKKQLSSWHPVHNFMAIRRGKVGSSDIFPFLCV